MTALMQRALRRLSAVPESEQDRLAQQVLSLPELAESDAEQESSPAETFASILADEPKPTSLVAIMSEPNGYSRSKEEIDRDLDALRDEWER